MSRLFSQAWKNYELIDAGGDRKLERWGDIFTIRPDRNAYFTPILTKTDWMKKAHFEFVEETKSKGEWKTLKGKGDAEWTIDYNDVTLHLHLTKYKHLGVFPEQVANWEFLENNLAPEDRFLNLFGYTGASSVVARSKGADVFHVDSVKQVLNWGRENMVSSNLADIHWVLEDALKFAQREVKRGHKYKGIIMDPPAFGLGAKKERWKIENKFPELLETALQLKSQGGFIIVNTYSPRLEAPEILSICKELCNSEDIQVDTLCSKTTTGKILEYGQRTLIQ